MKCYFSLWKCQKLPLHSHSESYDWAFSNSPWAWFPTSQKSICPAIDTFLCCRKKLLPSPSLAQLTCIHCLISGDRRDHHGAPRFLPNTALIFRSMEQKNIGDEIQYFVRIYHTRGNLGNLVLGYQLYCLPDLTRPSEYMCSMFSTKSSSINMPISSPWVFFFIFSKIFRRLKELSSKYECLHTLSVLLSTQIWCVPRFWL